jgi:hypothetical protein
VPQLDFILGQRLSEHFKLRLPVRNVLNPEIERTYGNDAGAPLYSAYTRGISVGLSLNYDF